MNNETVEDQITPNKNPIKMFFGFLIGGMAGAITVLLLAPQSGKDTRMQIREKGIDLQTQTTKMVNDRVEQIRTTVTDLKNSGERKIKELKQSALDLADEKLGS